MKLITFKILFFLGAFFVCLSSFSQIKKTNGAKIKSLNNTFLELTYENELFLEEHGVIRCLTVENEQLLKKKNPHRSNEEEFEKQLAPIIAKIKANRLAGKAQMTVYNIPVVIHVFHNGEPIGTAPNITDAQVISQIDVFNEDFRRMAGTLGGTNSTGAAVDVEINFCLAKQDEFGNPTNGINRVNIGMDGIYGANTTQARNTLEALKPSSQWDPTKYMNMWSVKFTGAASSLLGYAQFPSNSGLGGLNTSGGAADTDGVVAAYHTFGTIDKNDGTFILNAPYDRGRTMTHEVGHWLGLRHIWGDTSSCTNADYCADTPDASGSNGGCPTVDSCSSDGLGNDQVQNYMDYTNDSCMDTFTQDQKDRMQAVMSVSPRRMELSSSMGCEATEPIIAFSSITQSIEEGTTCGFTDVPVIVKIGKAPSANADVTISATGSASYDDFEVFGGNLTFPVGSAADQTFTVRINNDSFIEADETVELKMTLNANGGDATITAGLAQEQTITIINDDFVPSSSTTIDVYDEDFEDTSGWSVYDRDGDSNAWLSLTGLDGYGDILGTCGASETDATILGGTGSYNPDQYYVSDPFTIPTALTNASVSYVIGSYSNNGAYQEHYSVYLTTISSPSAYGDLEEYVLENDRELTSSGTEVRTHDLTSYEGLTVQMVIRHHNTAGNSLLLIDSINVDAVVGTAVQTSLNSGTLDQDLLSSTGTVYTLDSVSNNIMGSINNNNGVDYGCVDSFVSRNSGAPLLYQDPGVANYVMGKTFSITPSNIQITGDATLKFYFTQAEIDEWTSGTGNVVGDLNVIKDDNGTITNSSATLGSFGSNVTLEVTFSNGINGTYYFGREHTLSVGETEYEIFSVYPVPSEDYLNITLSTNNDVNITLFDIRGRQIISKLEHNYNETFTTQLDLSDVSAGVYLLYVNSGNKAATKKIIRK